MTTLKQISEAFESKLNDDREVESFFIKPLKSLLLKLKLVEKDKEIPTPYVKAEIVIPREIATSVGKAINSDTKMALLCIKFKDTKKPRTL